MSYIKMEDYPYDIIEFQKYLHKKEYIRFLRRGYGKNKAVLREHKRITGMKPGECLWPVELKDFFNSWKLYQVYEFLRAKKRIPKWCDSAPNY